MRVLNDNESHAILTLLVTRIAILGVRMEGKQGAENLKWRHTCILRATGVLALLVDRHIRKYYIVPRYQCLSQAARTSISSGVRLPREIHQSLSL